MGNVYSFLFPFMMEYFNSKTCERKNMVRVIGFYSRLYYYGTCVNDARRNSTALCFEGIVRKLVVAGSYEGT